MTLFLNFCIFKDGESHIFFILLLNYVIMIFKLFIYTFIQTEAALKHDLVNSPIPRY